MKSKKKIVYDSKAAKRISRGNSRHVRLQKSLCSKPLKKCFVNSLSRVLEQIISHNMDLLKVYSEVPFPGMKMAKSSRADLVFYVPETLIIIHEYKTTELTRVPEYLKHLYLSQVIRCGDNFLRTVNIAARQARFKNGKGVIKFYKLLTVRNYANKTKVKDVTEIVGDPLSVPNLKYDKLVKVLNNKTLFL